MRITFDQAQDMTLQGRSSTEKRSVSAKDTEKKAENAGAYTVQIGAGENRAQGGTYKKEALTAEEISMQAAGADMDVQKKYMAVMSNSMSGEDFQKMLEDGYNVSDVDVETLVTILDQIKVAVAKGGGEIAGYTDDLSKETLEAVLGSAAYAEAVENGIEDGAAAYMVKQQLLPTAENLYKAKYATGAGKSAPEMKMLDEESADGKAFREQIDKVLREAGLPENEKSRKEAAFLLAYDIPLTKENLLLYEKIKPFQATGERPLTETLLSRIAKQVYEGKPALQADLSKAQSIYEQAQTLYEAVKNLPPDAIEQAVLAHGQGKELTLKDMIESSRIPDTEVSKGAENVDAVVKENLKSGEKSKRTAKEEQIGKEMPVISESRELLTARRQLEEVRLKMTIEVNIKLLRSGFQIDTAPMEQLIEHLKAAEESLQKEGVLQVAEAVERLNDLRMMPMETLGFVVNREISFTIAALHEKGGELQSNYEKIDTGAAKVETARARYETMQTEVRADLGDSIKKAFRNVDDILADMNKEPSEENRRAVRMLGYNRLEMSEENINRALEVDRKVQTLFRDMKPGKVLQMIKDGVDVLHTDIEELDDYLREQNGSFLEETEDFARFLHKLDKSRSMTAAERESYIGIYRLIRQVEKADGKAQGYLLANGAELTMENLLSALRSGRRGTMDYKIDESFSGVDALQTGKNIVEQINAVSYENTAGYEETVKAFENAGKKAGTSGREAADLLKEAGEPVTVSNLLTASSVLQEDAGLYQRLEDYEKETKREQNRLESYVLGLHEAVTDEASLQDGMETFMAQAEEILREAEEKDGVTELDIKEMQQIYRGLRFRSALSKEARYQIPVRMEDGYTVMNLTVRKGTGTAQAEISMETKEYGRLEAVFTQNKEEPAETAIDGSLFAETKTGVALLQEMAGRVEEALNDAGFPAKKMTVMQGNRMRRSVFRAQTNIAEEDSLSGENEKNEISTEEFYQIAKIFLQTVRNE